MNLTWLNNDVVSRMIEIGIEPRITKNGLVIEGFYKSGQITLYIEDNQLFALARYNEVTTINNFEDLVWLNYDWWDRSKTRSDGWTQPARPWAEEMVRLGIVTKKVIPAREVYE